jgi:SAM-dependent methyltransferase
MFIADGCTSVDLVDRFYSKRSSSQHAGIYKELIARVPSLAVRVGAADTSDESTFPGLVRRYGASASAEEFFLASASHDAIVSRAVMEHVYDPRLAIRRMARALRPGGVMLHKVDLRDHGMFSPNFHELKFLEVPDWAYPRMTHNAGRPNRVLVHEYRAALAQTDLAFEILVTRLAGAGEVEPHVRYEKIDERMRGQAVSYVRGVRSRFAASFADVSDDDLAVAGIFIVARRRSASSGT